MSENNRPISQIVIDKKLDYSDIPDRARHGRWLRFNIFKVLLGLQPPRGVIVDVWIHIICTLIAVRGGLIASASTLTSMMRTVVGFLNRHGSDTPIIVSDFGLLKEVAEFVPHYLWAGKVEYLKSLIQILAAIADNCPYFRAFSGLDLDRDVISQGKSCVIEIPTLYPAWLRLFVIDLLIAQILYSRLHRRHKVDTTEVIIYFDEADADVSFISSDAAYADAYSVLAQLLRMGREYGIMVVIGTGTLGGMSKFISSSFQYKFFFNVSEGDQILHANRNLLLPHGGEAMLRNLDSGQCIVQQTQLGWSHPMWCEVDYVAPDRKRDAIEYDSHPFIPSKCLDELPELQSFLKGLLAQRARGNIRRDSAASKHARKFLNVAILHPFKPVARLWSDVGTNIRSATQAKVRAELEAAKLARYADPRLSRRKVLLIWPEDPAYELFGHRPPKHRGHGDIEHTHYCNWINMVGQAEGYRTKMEALIRGTNHLADVIWQVGEELWAFEVISKCHQNIIGHLTASFIQSDTVSIVSIVAPQKCVLEQVRKLVHEEMSLAPYEHRIQYELVEVYMERLWS
jgi:hypothetical protein